MPANIGRPWNKAVSADPSSRFCGDDFGVAVVFKAAFPLTWFNAGHDTAAWLHCAVMPVTLVSNACACQTGKPYRRRGNAAVLPAPRDTF
jgi:hypothetical protein